MLGVSNATELNVSVWRALPSRVELPEKIAAVQHARAGESVKPDCQRRYARKLLQSPAIAIVADTSHACLMKDISRIGAGFYSPVNVLPKTPIRVWLPNGNILQLRVTRCRRLADHCYEVGTRFVGAS